MDQSALDENAQKPEWMTKGYLEKVLRENLYDSDIAVDNFDVRATTVKGDNFASTIHRVAVAYRDSKNHQGNKSFIVKSFPSSEMMQSMLKINHSFDKEIAAYSKLIPAMNELTETPLPSTRFYSTDREDTVILEDLSSQGFKMADRKKRLDLAHSILALKALARFHGLSYAVLQRDPAITELFPEPTKSKKKEEAWKAIGEKMYNNLASIIEKWTGYERFAGKILSRIEEIHKKQEECLVLRKGKFNVLIHGDFWVNNMLFRYNEETSDVEEVYLIDLQGIRHASPAVDLQYFLTSSLADGIREEHEDYLLEVYHQALAETLDSAGVDSSIYSLDDLRKDYNEKIPFGFVVGIFILGAVTAEPSETMDFEGMTDKSLEDGSANPFEKSFRGVGYKHALQQHLLYHGKKGVL